MYRTVCAKENEKDVWSFPESSIERPRSPRYFKSALFWYLLHVFLFLGCSKGSLKTARIYSDRRPPCMVAPQYRAAEICQKHNLLISCCLLQARQGSGSPTAASTWKPAAQRVTHFTALQLHFIQCPFPNQIQFGLEKLHPKIAYDFPNQFQFGLERKKLILQDADSKPNSDWFGKF